ncbi:transcriptional regulator family: C2H2 zinc finger and Fungal Specific TF [Trichoderma aggressivum f. europaeum]|uniref:Transcriptional regulator family: C2H2 zinc finger and Fungal Specific TF n=1 Tax=Trichoderma aggressivum f. europaeum TaxID=173218 RepID=A0AAE1LYB2_9HYPO|nr:transcriptional regulator family: C2H2 zinc finger and Fungal Specific TF [Trichoderma aggressivum f. europaeum]
MPADSVAAGVEDQNASYHEAEPQRKLRNRQCRGWKCTHCGQAFKKREHMVRHIRSHTKERPFACDICSKSYGRRDSLIRHARTHDRVGSSTILITGPLMPSPTGEDAVPSHSSLFRRSDIQDDVSSANNPPDESACFTDSIGLAAENIHPPNHWAASGADIEPTSYLSSLLNSSTRADTTSLGVDQASNVWGSWSDMEMFDFGGNTYDPSWLVGRSFDINALTSSISATGSPWLYGDISTSLTQSQLNDRFNGDSHTDESIADNNNNIRTLVRNRWHTRPVIESAHPYALKRPEGPDRVDEAYRAGLSSRLRPCLHDDVLPSSDFLNICIKLYFAKFQPIFPIVHATSFRPSSENALLLLSICSIGALFVGSAGASARGRGIFMKLNKAILASWEVYIYRGGREALAVAQAVALGQTFGMLSGKPNDLLLTESFHGTIIAWARQAGMFQIKDSLQETNHLDPNDLETTWRSWSQTEETVRVLAALHIHDSEFATIFHHEPLLRHEPGRLPRCCTDELFTASTAAQWQTMIKSLHSSSPSTESQHHTSSAGMATTPSPYSFMNAYVLLSGHNAAIQEARCATLNEAMIGDFHCRLTTWYEAYFPSIRYPSRDPHCLMVLWHETFMSLYVCFDLLERVIGREGSSMRDGDLARIRDWVTRVEGQRCVIHAMLIYKRLQTLPIIAEPAIHVPKALFYAGLVVYCYAKFRPDEAPHGDIDIPELRTSDLGRVSVPTSAEPTTASLRQFDPSTLYNVTDLLRRQGHWELSRRFSSILEALIDDLADSTVRNL